MGARSVRMAWIVSGVLFVAGIILTVVFPQPFVTYYCSANVCPTESSGGFSGGYVVIFVGFVAAVVAAIITMVDTRRRGAIHS